MQALDILLMLSAHVSAETILDRILPYVLSMLHDPIPRVRVRALHTLCKALQYVKTVPVSDTNIFPEYILPGLAVVSLEKADQSVPIPQNFSVIDRKLENLL